MSARHTHSRRNPRFIATAVLGTAVAAAVSLSANAATIELRPGQSFEQAVEALNPGDTLIVHAGDYLDTGRISITVQGTDALPVVIKGAEGETRPHIGRAASAAVQNTINVEGARHVTFSNLEITSNGGDAFNLNSTPSFITIEDVELHDIDVGVNLRSSMNNIVVRRAHIHNTGADGGTGEGMYIGCNDNGCQVRDSVFENNWIHDTRNSTQGDGIEVKLGSHSNLVRDNVIYDTGFPCVLVYGTVGNPVNIVEGNVMWNCGDSGIQAAADAIIRNNLILDSPGSNGFNSQPHQAATPQNLQFVHNTLIGGSPCIRLSSWDNKTGLVFANNAIYCASGQFAIGGLTNVTITGNVMSPAVPGFPTSTNRVGGTLAQDFVNAAQRNLWPTANSALLNAGAAAHMTTQDFNGTNRTSPPDAGAYEWTGNTNPGWTVQPGFKGVSGGSTPAPTVTLSANPTSVALNGSTQLTWSTSDATSCTASGGTSGWAGSKPLQGSANAGPLTAATTFGLSCTGSGGTTQKSVTVSIVAAPTVNFSANPTTVMSGGSSTLTWSSMNATGCTASGDWAGNKATSGTQSTGALTTSKTYNLSCTGAGGTTQKSASVTVSASPPPAPTVSFSANPTTVNSGGSSTLTWSSTNATACTASGDWTGSKATSGNQSTGALTASKTYNLSCTGTGGTTQQSVSVTVNGVPPPPPAATVDLSANPLSISAGGTSTLSWTSTNATSCTASGAWAGSKATSGTESTAALSNTSTFTLMCTGAGGDASDSVTVTVVAGGGGGGGGSDSGSGGGGAFGLWSILFLIAPLGLRAAAAEVRRSRAVRVQVRR